VAKRPAGAESSDWQGALRERGYRITPQRQLVFEAVLALGHSTPEELLTKVQSTAEGVNLSTIYRTLEVLEEVGLVTHTHLGHGAPTYHPAAEAHHLHLVCRECGSVTEAEVALADGLVGSLEASHGFDTDVHHFAIFGRCATCRAKGDES
jgi:Fur family transcriptional regulator, ferric uptake regulator